MKKASALADADLILQRGVPAWVPTISHRRSDRSTQIIPGDETLLTKCFAPKTKEK